MGYVKEGETMQSWINVIFQSENLLQIQLKEANWLDTDVFQKMEVDETSVHCVLYSKEKAIVSYTLENFISLRDVFKQHVFEEEEGYIFLHNLFENLIAASRNKPVLLSPDYVYVTPYGDEFRFIVLPLCVEQWMVQKKEYKEWLEFIYTSFQTTTAFEIPGFIMKFMNSPEYSLPNLILGLSNLRKLRYPPKYSFFFKKKENNVFRVEEPMHSLYKIEVKKEILESNKTQVIGTVNSSSAYLDVNHKYYDLISEVSLIGRGIQCDIRFQEKSVSLKHAKISYLNERYYIQDLKSSNGTYLNDKKVIRKMRLRDGMNIRFGNIECVFHQS